MKTLIMLMQLFGNLNMPVHLMQLEDHYDITSCDSHYDKGLQIVTCKQDNNSVIMLIGTDEYFWQLEAHTDIINAKNFLKGNK